MSMALKLLSWEPNDRAAPGMDDDRCRRHNDFLIGTCSEEKEEEIRDEEFLTDEDLYEYQSTLHNPLIRN
jgi:hypothetical protein